MIKSILLAAFCTVVTCKISGQSKNQSYFIEVAAGALKLSTNSNDLHSHPFIGNVRVGYRTKNRLAYGIEYNHLIYRQPYSSRSPLQTGGSTRMNIGTTTDTYNSVGVFAEYRVKLGDRLNFVPGVFIHYLKNKYASSGDTYQDGTPLGIPFERGTVYGYVARAGLSLTFNYTISSATAVTFRFLELEHRFGKYDNASFIAIVPTLGIQYYLPTKSQQR